MESEGHVDTDSRVEARDPEQGKLSVIEPAPGRYVKMKITDVLQQELLPERAQTS